MPADAKPAKIDAATLSKVLADPAVQYVEEEGTRKLVTLSWGLDRIDQRDRRIVLGVYDGRLIVSLSTATGELVNGGLALLGAVFFYMLVSCTGFLYGTMTVLSATR